MIGVFDCRWVELVVEVLKELGLEKVWIVYGLDGMDEVMIMGFIFVCEFINGVFRLFEIILEDVGLFIVVVEDLKGGILVENVKVFWDVFVGV